MLALTKDRPEVWVVAAIAAHATESGDASKLLDMVSSCFAVQPPFCFICPSWGCLQLCAILALHDFVCALLWLTVFCLCNRWLVGMEWDGWDWCFLQAGKVNPTHAHTIQVRAGLAMSLGQFPKAGTLFFKALVRRKTLHAHRGTKVCLALLPLPPPSSLRPPLPQPSFLTHSLLPLGASISKCCGSVSGTG
jgi:hypothetical protein